MLKSLIVAASLLSAALAPALAKDVRLAHDQRFSPFSEVVSGRSEGMTVDILRAAAERSGLSVVFVPVPFEEMQATLTDGRADGVFPLAINEERRRTFDFSAPLLITGGAIFTLAPEAVPDNLAALARKTVVTPSSGPLAGFIKRTAPDVNLVATSNYDESFAKLLSGEADAAALNLQVGTQMATKAHAGKVSIPTRLFLELPLAVAVTKGQNAGLLQKLDAGLAAIRADGTWEKINGRWMGGKP